MNKGHQLSSTKFYENEQLPEFSDFDWLIVMGGPMGVYDDEKYAWLNSEKEFIRKCIQAGKTVLGICLGAQLIAASLGAKVYPNREKEIGWFPVTLASEVVQNPLSDEFTGSIRVFHWHGDTFDLPNEAIRLASSGACLNQAFRIGKKVLGLQFHFEVTEESIKRLITNCSDELVNAKYIQSAEMMMENSNNISELNNRMFRLLDVLEAKTEN